MAAAYKKYYILKELGGETSFEVVNLFPGRDLSAEDVASIIKEKGLSLIKTEPGKFEVWA